MSKFDDFKAYLRSLEHEFSIIGLSETWLNSSNVNDFPLSNYNSIGVVRKNKQGGGVSLYIKKSYQFRERFDLATNDNDVIESQVIELTAKPKNILIGIINRPPNGKLEEFKECLSNLLQTLDLGNKKCFLMVNFNLDLLKSDENEHIKDFTNTMFSSAFYPLISRPTRISNTSATLIDNIFVKKIEESYKCGILFTYPISDHLPVFLTTSNSHRSKHCNAVNIKQRLINDKTINCLCQDLKHQDWKEVYSLDDVQYAYDHFYSNLYRLFGKNIPLVKPKSKLYDHGQKVPWITKGIRKSRRTKNVLYKKFIKKPTKENESIYKTYRNKFNKVKNVAKKNYYNKEFNEHKGNLRYLWKLINEVINKGKSKPELQDCFVENETLKCL